MTGNEHFLPGLYNRPQNTTISSAILTDDAALCALVQHTLALSQSPKFSLSTIGSRQFSINALTSTDLLLIDATFSEGQFASIAQTVKSHQPSCQMILLLDDSEALTLTSVLANAAHQGIDQFILKSDLSLRQLLNSLAPQGNTSLTTMPRYQTIDHRHSDNITTPGEFHAPHTETTPTTATDETLNYQYDVDNTHTLAIDLENERVHINALPASPLCSESDRILNLSEWYSQLQTKSAADFRDLLENAQNYRPIAKELKLTLISTQQGAIEATLTDIQLKNNGQGKVIGASAQLQLNKSQNTLQNTEFDHHSGFDNLPNSSDLLSQDKIWQNVTKSLPMLCLLLDEQGYIVRIINNGDQSKQLPTDLAPGIKLTDALDIESLDGLGEAISRTLNTGKAHQQTIAFPSEHGLRWLDTSLTKLRGDSGLSRQVVWTAFDITSNRHDYQELLKNHDSLAQILEDAPFLFFQKDGAGRYLRVNKSFCDLFDLRADVISGRNDTEIFRDWDTHFKDVTEQAIAKANQQDVVELSYNEKLHGTEQSFQWRTLVQKRQGDNQLEFICGFGLARPVTSSESMPVDNVSELHTTPNLAMSGALKQDFKIILNSLVNYAELALSQKSPGRAASIADYLSQVELTAHRTRELMLEKTTPDESLSPSALLLTPIIEETVDMLRPTLPGSLSFETVYTSAKEKALVDEASIKKIVMLLLLNAKSTAETAVADGKTDQKIRLTLELNSIQQENCVACDESLSEDYVSLTVQTAADNVDDTALSKLISAAKQSTHTNSDSNVIALTHRIGGHAMIRHSNNMLSLQLLFKKA